jgi:hypothetical protein
MLSIHIHNDSLDRQMKDRRTIDFGMEGVKRGTYDGIEMQCFDRGEVDTLKEYVIHKYGAKAPVRFTWFADELRQHKGGR